MLIRTIATVSLGFTIFANSAAFAQTTAAYEDLATAKAEIESLKQDIELKKAELRVMELQMARQANAPAPTPPTVAANATDPMPAVVPSQPPPTPIPQRAHVDPAPYEAAITGRVSTFRTNQSSNWLVLDEKRLVYWVLDDEAYLLNLAQACPGLLATKKLKLENFSTKVRAGKDKVVFSDQHCLIESIEVLGGRKLPKPPRK